MLFKRRKSNNRKPNKYEIGYISAYSYLYRCEGQKLTESLMKLLNTEIYSDLDISALDTIDKTLSQSYNF